MGFALLLSSLICRWNGRAVTLGVMSLCAVYLAVDVSRNGFWRNDMVFFTRMTEDAPGKYLGYNNLGMRYYRQGNVEPALRYLIAADSKPDIPFTFLMADAYIFWKENLRDRAEKSLLRALDLEPGNPEPYLDLMVMYEQNGNKALAQAYRAKAKELVSDIDKALTDRAVLLCSSAETSLSRHLYINAEFFLWQALQIKPEFIPALIDMGRLKAEQGNFADAQQFLNRALAIDPLNAPAHYNLSTVYSMEGRIADAQQEMIRYREAEAHEKQKGQAAPR
jgi:tetratricopeptide (TPR) repeat protein